MHHDTTLPFEYETMPYPPPWVPIHSKDRYLLTRRLGTGKFSDVFEAIDLGPNWKDFDLESDDCAIFDDNLQSKEYPRVVIKCLKPIAERKIRRELYLLHRCRRLPNIIRLKALILPSCDENDATSMPCLVMEHAGTEWLGTSHLDPPLTPYEIRYFTYQLLIAMRALHEAGIMHRDIKPRNVMIQRSSNSAARQPRLTLIDLVLADLYQTGRAYNVRVASRHYKAPELLLGDTFYHGPAVDIWAFGCLLASLLSNREPFFRGRVLMINWWRFKMSLAPARTGSSGLRSATVVAWRRRCRDWNIDRGGRRRGFQGIWSGTTWCSTCYNTILRPGMQRNKSWRMHSLIPSGSVGRTNFYHFRSGRSR
jgi:serine/threonine protein kinase